ncbi:hypothetical protein HPB50_007460 [Hyalomma asiaticum]|uniref:Uncharacterized protein n=1 Tax=Hyalomma asiaticum TaxID=266040 RepID=A0ACB7TFY7_HYAAI|nr:hypothetical protein HPB50_007460 [Hyalomma asiaticum]
MRVFVFQSVTLHTDLGDIKIELFCEACPKTAENFLALCASDYYNGCLFHRNIKGFMVQTGDPTGTGKGGESIWGEKFADEIRDELKGFKSSETIFAQTVYGAMDPMGFNTLDAACRTNLFMSDFALRNSKGFAIEKLN